MSCVVDKNDDEFQSASSETASDEYSYIDDSSSDRMPPSVSWLESRYNPASLYDFSRMSFATQRSMQRQVRRLYDGDVIMCLDAICVLTGNEQIEKYVKRGIPTCFIHTNADRFTDLLDWCFEVAKRSYDLDKAFVILIDIKDENVMKAIEAKCRHQSVATVFNAKTDLIPDQFNVPYKYHQLSEPIEIYQLPKPYNWQSNVGRSQTNYRRHMCTIQ